MRLVVANMLVLMAITALEPAHAAEPRPVCREPSVIDEISREIRARQYYSRVDPAFVTEQATLDPRVVQCQVCVLSTPYDSLRYDSLRFGDRPVRQCLVRIFEVQILPSGFVVRDLR